MLRKKAFFIVAILLLLTAEVFSQTEKPDALKQYRTGRNYESANRPTEAEAAYKFAVEICEAEIQINSQNMDSHAVLTWSLLRLKQYDAVISKGNEALKLKNDYRIVESLGEAYFYLDNYKDSLKMMERYVDALPRGERVSTAYFFIGEIYRLTQRYNRADIAYSSAVYYEPGIALWWYRLGLAREYCQDKESAKQAFEKALQLRPDYKEASDGLKRIS